VTTVTAVTAVTASHGAASWPPLKGPAMLNAAHARRNGADRYESHFVPIISIGPA
jgi:hypothetical protein